MSSVCHNNFRGTRKGQDRFHTTEHFVLCVLILLTKLQLHYEFSEDILEISVSCKLMQKAFYCVLYIKLYYVRSFFFNFGTSKSKAMIWAKRAGSSQELEYGPELYLYTVCFLKGVKKYLLTPRAWKISMTWKIWHFFTLFRSFWYLGFKVTEHN